MYQRVGLHNSADEVEKYREAPVNVIYSNVSCQDSIYQCRAQRRQK